MALLAMLFLLAGAALVLYGWGIPPFDRRVQYTDNAMVRGQTTVISPQVSGYVVDVPVQDFQAVRQGQVIAHVDDRIYRQRVAQARAAVAAQQATLSNVAQSQRSAQAGVAAQAAAVANARAQLVRAQADMRRVDELAADRSLSQRERDQTFAALKQAEAAVQAALAQQVIAQEQVRTVTVGRGGLEAGVENAQAVLRLAEIDLANTVITAPRDGRVSEVTVRVGQYVTAGSQLLFLVPSTLWITANYKEAQTARMQAGQPAWITVDGLAGARLDGRVTRLSPGTGNEFSIIKPDNATGNYVKVSQRIGVRIELDAGQPLFSRLRPGMSVEARVDTGAAGGDVAPASGPAP